MYFPEDFLEDLRNRLDIVDVVSSYIPLTRAGSNYKALCPFHEEKTPSFFVSPDKQIFHCFGCGKGGNVFTFVMEYEKVSFPEAVELLARKYGIPLPRERAGGQRPSSGISLKNIFAINELASRFYHKNLFSKRGKPALDYLFSRGLTVKTIKEFRLGYAPGEWDEFVSLAKGKGASDRLILSSGLGIESERGKVYDRFRNRIVFPVFDLQGRVVGFGGRVLDPQDSPKYLNSPDTPVFKKSQLLYGLHRARSFATQKLFLVEGYMDVIGLAQAGIKNAVACLGTSLTDTHLKILQRYAKELVLVFDPDTAGINAARRAVRLGLNLPMTIRVLFLPEGLDPDEFVLREGEEAFERLADSAEEGFEFLLRTTLAGYDLDNPKQKSLALKELFDLLKDVEDSIIQSEYLNLVSQRLAIPDALARREFAKYLRARARYGRQRLDTSPEGEDRPPSGPEVELLKVALCEPSLRSVVLDVLEPTDFADEDVLLIWDRLKAGKDLNSIIVELDSGDLKVSQAVETWLRRLGFESVEAPEELVYKGYEIIKRRRADRRIEMLKEMIRRRQRTGEDASDLITELNEVIKAKGGM